MTMIEASKYKNAEANWWATMVCDEQNKIAVTHWNKSGEKVCEVR